MTDDQRELLKKVAAQLTELREMNVEILKEAAMIQAALNTLLTLHARENGETMDLYRSQFSSIRESIAAAMRHLELQAVLEDFLHRTELDFAESRLPKLIAFPVKKAA